MITSKFNEAVSVLLSEKLKTYSGQSLNSTTCMEIYQTIFDSLVEIFSKSNVDLSNESVNYISQQYYDSILINNTQELDPNIFTQRAKLENIHTKELALLAVMLNGTDFATPVIFEVKRRG